MQRARLSISSFPYACALLLGLINLCLPQLSAAQDISGFISDDFSAGQLDTTTWSLVDPRNDSSASISGNQLLISVPAGTSHDAPNNAENTVARVMQPIFNTDFELEAKFDSPVQAGQIQGIMVEETAGSSLLLLVYRSGTETRVQSVQYTNNVSSNRVEKVIADNAPIFLRVKREGNNWTHYFSYDGIVWNAARVLTSSKVPATAGILAGNFGGASAPAHTAVIDYMFSTATPIEPEDGEVLVDNTGPYIRDIKKLAGSSQFSVQWETDEAANATIEYGTTNAYGASVDNAALATSHDLLVDGLAPDTYHFRLRSSDAAGNVTETEDFTITVSANPYLDLWYGTNQTFGLLGSDAQRWANILGHVSGANAITSLEYSLNGGNSRTLSLGADGLRLQDDNDFNADIELVDLLSGANDLAITATDSVGNQLTENLSINYLTGNTWPLPYTIDWSGVTNIENAVQVVDGAWEITGSGLRTRQTGYDRAINIGDITWENYEVTVPVTLHGVDQNCFDDLVNNPCNGGPLVGVLLRWQGHQVTFIKPNWEWRPLGALGAYRWFKPTNRFETQPGLFMLDGSGIVTHQDSQRAFSVGTTHVFKLRAETDTSGQGLYKTKMWPLGQAEPSQWDIEQTQALGASNDNGSLLLLAHYVDATFGNVTVTSLDGNGGDTTAPVISNVQTVVTDTTATISWTTDELASSVVDYGTDTSYGSNAGSATLVSSHSVTLSNLVPGVLYHFLVSSTDASSNTASGSDTTFTTTGGIDVTSPVISNVQAVVTDTTATISWTTDEPATSVVNYGLSAGYGSSESDPALVTSHNVILANLTPGVQYHFLVSSADASSNNAVDTDRTFTTNAGSSSPSGIVSDAFNDTSLNTSVWNWVDPVGNSSYAMTGSQLAISVPQGSSHDLWTNANQAPRVLQPANNTDFELEAKFDSAVALRYQLQGIVVEGSNNRLLRFDFYHEGTNTRVHAATLTNGTATKQIRTIIFGGAPIYMRVVRQGDLWSQYYSYDGANWTLAGTFSYALEVTAAGVFGGNAGPNPAYTALVDYFTIDGLPPGSGGGDVTAPVISNVQTTVTDTTATITWQTDEPASSTVDYGTDSNYGSNAGSATLVSSHSVTLTNLVPGVLYHFLVSSTDGSNNTASGADTTFTTDPPAPDTTAPVISNVQAVVTDTTATISWTTDELASSVVDYGTDTSYGSNAGNPTLVSSHSVTLTSLTPGTEYHFLVSSADASSNTASGSDTTFTTNAGADTTPPVISNVQATVTDTTATITWVTNEPATSIVDYGIDTNFGLNASDNTLVLNHSLTLTGLAANTPYFYRLSSADATGNLTSGTNLQFTTDEAVGTAPGLVASWSLDEGSGDVANDTSGNGNDGSLQNGPVWNGNVLNFDGINDYIDTGNLDVPDSALTLMGWFRADDLANCSSRDCRILSKATGTATDDHYMMVSTIKTGQTTRLRFRLKLGGVTQTLVANTGNLSVDTWVHFAAVYNGSSMVLYKDGVTVGSLDVSGAITTDSTVPLWLGDNPQVAGSRPWKGSLADISILSRALSTQEINDSLNNTLPGGGGDSTAPVISNVQAVVTDTTATITWDTDEPATSAVDYGTDSSYGSNAGSATLVSSHSVTLTSLTPGIDYHFLVSSTDGSNNTASGTDATFTTNQVVDTTAPVISNVQAVVTDTTATITWDTDEPATSAVDYGTDSSYGSNAGSATLVSSHSVTLSNLVPGVLYHFLVSSTDASNNTASGTDATFTTNQVVDTTAPVISNVQAVVTDTTATISWTTDELASSVVDYGTDTSYGSNAGSATLVSSHSVTLTSLVPGVLYHFLVSSTDASSNTASGSDTTFTTTGGIDVTSPVISNVQAVVTDTTATISWTTDEPATSVVNYGLSAGYGSSESDPALVTSHNVILANLTPGVQYHFLVSSADASSNNAVDTDRIFTTNAGSSSPSGIVSDAFNDTSLNTSVWNWVDPVGNSNYAMTGSQLAISVPQGSSHDLWTNANQAPRVLQPANNTDFELEAKFDSAVALRYQLQGIVVEGSNNRLLRFDFYHEGTNTRVHAATLTNGTATKQIRTIIFGGAPIYMRVVRQGDLWSQYYSYDGANWTLAGTFSYALEVTAAGVFGGNAGPNPAYTALVDYFTIDGLPPGSGGGDVTAPVISNVQTTVTDTTATITWDTDEPATSAVDYGTDSSYGSNAGSATLVSSHSVTLSNLEPGTDYHFLVSSTDGSNNTASGADTTFTTDPPAPDTTAPVISNVQAVVTDTTATISWTTDELASSVVDYGTDTSYGSNAGSATLVSSHSVTLSNLVPGVLYHFLVSSTDASSNTASGSDTTFTTNAGADTTPPVISNVQATVTDTSATITWVTDEATSSLVEYGSDTGYGMSVEASGLTLNHNIGLVNLVSGSPYHYRITATDASGNTTVGEDQTFTTESTEFPPGLVFSVPMHEGAGNTVFDNSGNNLNGSLTNGPSWAGTTLVFDGVDDYVDMGNVDVPGSALTLMGRFRADDLANCAARDCRIISKASGTATDDHYFMVSTIQSGSETRLRFRLKANGTTSTLVASSGDLQNGVWVHFAAVYDGSNMLLYKDGALLDSLAKSGNVDTDNTLPLWIGGNPLDGTARPWAGAISDVMVYNQALTAQQIADLVGSANNLPSFTSTPVTTAIVNQAYTYNVTATDLDADAILAVTAPTLPSWLNLVDNGQGSATLSGLPVATGSYPVILEVSDQNNAVTQQSFTIVVTDSSAATNLLVFDWNEVVTQADRGFPWNDPPLASANGNWVTPINYAEGTFHLRAEIRGQPVAQTNRLQFCIWQYSFTLETCTRAQTVDGTPGNVVTWSQTINSMWKLNGNPMDWANPRQRYGVAIKNTSGLPVSNFNGWEWNGEDPTLWYPLDMRFTVVVVPKGGTFAGWNSFLN